MNKRFIAFVRSLMVLLGLSFLFLPIIHSDDLWISAVTNALVFDNPSPLSYILEVLVFALPLAMMIIVVARLIFGDKMKIAYIVVLSICLVYFIYFGVIGSSLLFLIPVILFAIDLIYDIAGKTK